MSDPYALILAGGSGTRFWPLSRNSKPKQLLNLFGTQTLLDETLHRLEGLVPRENILILTNTLQETAVREVASSLPAENIFPEPSKRDTGPAVALGIGLVAARDPDATMMVLPSDQRISDTEAYQSVLRDAVTTASLSDGLVTIGIKPTWACPSYGYIELGGAAEIPGLDVSHPPREAIRFTEKPEPHVAEQFFASGNFSWNAGMFIWSVPTVLNELHQHAPQLGEFVAEIRDSEDVHATVSKRFGELHPISIDYSLMQEASRVLTIEATFDWDDVGSWLSVAKYLDLAPEEIRTNCPLSAIDSKNNIVFSTQGTRIALLGVENLIVVQTDDALLIANRHKADDIKKLVDALPDELL